MGLQLETKELCCTIKIEGELTIYVANEFKQRVQAELDSCEQIDVDLSQVSEIDGSGLQFLIALKKLDNKSSQKKVRFIDHSQIVIETFELLNLSARFDDPMILAAEKLQ